MNFLCNLKIGAFSFIGRRTEEGVRFALESETGRRNHPLILLPELEVHFLMVSPNDILFDGFGPKTQDAVAKAINPECLDRMRLVIPRSTHSPAKKSEKEKKNHK